MQKDDSEEKIERKKVEQDTEGVVVVVGMDRSVMRIGMYQGLEATSQGGYELQF